MWAGAPQHPNVVAQGPKWPALRFIAVLLKIIAWIQLVIGVILTLSTAFAGSFLTAHTNVNIGGTGLLAALIVFISFALAFIWTYASAEIILLFITIEKNTRKY